MQEVQLQKKSSLLYDQDNNCPLQNKAHASKIHMIDVTSDYKIALREKRYAYGGGTLI